MYFVVKETIDFLASAANENDKAEKDAYLKIMHHLGCTYKKLTTH